MKTTLMFPYWINYEVTKDGVLINTIRNIVGILLVDGYKDYPIDSWEGQLLDLYIVKIEKKLGI
jgi:hypothetical protein